MTRPKTGALIAIALVAGLAAGCATTDSDLTPDAVRFHITGVSDVSLAGVDLSYVTSPADLSAADLLRITASLERGTLPLELTVHVAALNPGSNPAATLTRLGWTLQLAGRDASSGVLNDPIDLPAGVATDLGVPVEADLHGLFSGNARDLVQRVITDLGAGGGPIDLRLLTRPEVETAYGPIPYPDPFVISTEVVP